MEKTNTKNLEFQNIWKNTYISYAILQRFTF